MLKLLGNCVAAKSRSVPPALAKAYNSDDIRTDDGLDENTENNDN